MINRKAKERGSAAVEFAVVLPLLMLVFFLLVDMGRFFYVTNSVYSASQDAARASALGESDLQIQAIGTAALGSSPKVASGSTEPRIVITSTACTGSPAQTEVTVQVGFDWITPGGLFGLFNSSGTTGRDITAKGVRLCSE